MPQEPQQIYESINEPKNEPKPDMPSLGSTKVSLITVVLIILAVAAAIAVYWLQTEDPGVLANNFVVKPVRALFNKNASWQTYYNEKYGYEFMYPSDHTVFYTISNNVLIPANSQSDSVLVIDDEKLIESGEPNALRIKAVTADISALDWLKEKITKNEWYNSDLNILDKIEEIAFRDKEAIQIITTGDITSPGKLIIIHQDKGFIVIGESLPSDILDKIIDSFKFTK